MLGDDGRHLFLAQAAKRISVAVDHDGYDQVGQSVTFALKEAIRKSEGFLLVDHEPLLPAMPRIIVRLVSVDGFAGEKGVSSAIGITIVYDSMLTAGRGIYVTSSVLACGRTQVESCAKNTLPSIDRAVEYLRKTEPSL